MVPRLSSPPLPLPVRARDSAPQEAGRHRKTWGFCSGDRALAPGTERTDSLKEVRCSELELSSSPALWGGY